MIVQSSHPDGTNSGAQDARVIFFCKLFLYHLELINLSNFPKLKPLLILEKKHFKYFPTDKYISCSNVQQNSFTQPMNLIVPFLLPIEVHQATSLANSIIKFLRCFNSYMVPLSDLNQHPDQTRFVYSQHEFCTFPGYPFEFL